jgi:glycosyltransferase involved in cell wall biosynthesis
LTSEPPFVSVIVPVFNDARRLVGCIEGLRGQSYPSERFEVLVIDNGSTDDPAAAVDRHGLVRLMVEPKPGPYAARNLGIAKASGEVLAFTDADCVPAPEWLEAGVRELNALSADVLGGAIEVMPRVPRRPNPAELYEMLYGYRHQRSVSRHSSCFTANHLRPATRIR